MNYAHFVIVEIIIDVPFDGTLGDDAANDLPSIFVESNQLDKNRQRN
jgi:hypothetical protein